MEPTTSPQGPRPLLLIPFLLLPLLSGVQLARADTQVNSYTTSSQYQPAVASDGSGAYVVVWASLGSAGGDNEGFSIQGQRYAADGTPQGAQFQVNSYTTSDQRQPAIGVDADGDFVIVWESSGSSGTDSSGTSIQGQRYAADGTPQGAQFQVNTYTSSAQSGSAVDLDADGNFVVTWTSLISAGPDSSSYSIQGQRYSSDGSATGVQFQVNSETSGEQTSADVAVGTNGDFVVTWRSATSSGGDTSADSVQGQRFAADGLPVGAQFQVNTYTTSVQTAPAVDVDALGNFVVTWISTGSDGTDSDGYSIQGQRYSVNGTLLGAQFQVNSYTPSLQFDPDVAVHSNGDFAVVWNSFGSNGTDSSGSSIQAQRYAADGSPISSEVQVNTFTTSFQDNPGLSTAAGGQFVVVWNSNGSEGNDSSAYSIQSSGPDPVPVRLQSFSVE